MVATTCQPRASEKGECAPPSETDQRGRRQKHTKRILIGFGWRCERCTGCYLEKGALTRSRSLGVGLEAWGLRPWLVEGEDLVGKLRLRD